MSDTMKTLIFDFDGTIADTLDRIFKIYNKMSAEFGYRKVNKKELEVLRNKTHFEILRKIGEFDISIFKLPFIINRGREELAKEIGSFRPFSGIKETLRELKRQGVRLGILTSNSKNNVEVFLKKNNIDFFEFVYEKNFFGKGRALKSLIKRHSIDKDQAVYVGDETRDVAAAKEAGVGSAAVTWGFNKREILEKQKPDFLLEKPGELTALEL